MNEFDFHSTDGLRLSGIDWSIDNPKGVIAMVHGHGEHKMRYQYVASFFNDKELAFVALDLRGHGISQGSRGHTPSYQQWMDDIEHFLMEVRNRYTEIPLVIYGHSMGGNIVANYLLRKPVHEISAAILSGSLFKIAFEPPSWKVNLGKIMANVWPSLAQPTGLNPEHISTDNAEVEKYINDPLVHDKMSAKMFVEIFAAAEWALANKEKLSTPTLVMHGSSDQITSPIGSEEFAKNSSATLKLWEGMYHEIHNEVNKQDVLNYEWEWLGQVLG